MLIETVFTGTGPAPKTRFQTEIDGAALLYLTGTAFLNQSTVDTAIGVSAFLDGREVGTAWITANADESGVHKTLVPALLPVKLSPGEHILTLQAVAGARIDENDNFAVSLLRVSGMAPFVWSFRGPVPQYVDFESSYEGTAMAFYAGSGFSPTGGDVIGFPLILDGGVVNATFTVVQEANSHHAAPPAFVPIPLTPGKHQIGLSTINGDFSTDGNDYYTVAILY